MIRRQVVMPVTPERLWAALTDPDQMVGWFGARVEWELKPGSPARFHGDDGHDRAGRVEVVRPGRHLRFRWWPDPSGGAAAALEVAEAEVTEVSYVLEAVPDGTRLTVQEEQVEARSAGSLEARASASRPAGTGSDGRLVGAARWAESDGQLVHAPGWTEWDGRLVGAWAGLVTPALQGVRA